MWATRANPESWQLVWLACLRVLPLKGRGKRDKGDLSTISRPLLVEGCSWDYISWHSGRNNTGRAACQVPEKGLRKASKWAENEAGASGTPQTCHLHGGPRPGPASAG